MLNILKKTLRTHTLLPAGTHVLLAVSGGADSVSLLHALHALNIKKQWTLTVAHLNHGIRGVESNQDEAWIQDLCKELGLSCCIGHARVPAYAKKHALSLEMAARNRRRAFLLREAKRVGAHCIATAHTSDDQAETVLLRLVRGAGLKGLGGMSYVRSEGRVLFIKPMLDITHRQAIQFLTRNDLSWREDASNRDDRFLRNRVRHELLPLLETRFNPSVRDSLIRTATVLRDEEQWMTGQVKEALASTQHDTKPGGLNVNVMAALPPALSRRVVRTWLEARGVPVGVLGFEMVESVLKLAGPSRGSKQVNLGAGWVVARRYDAMTVEKGASPERATPFRGRIQHPGETVFPVLGLRVVTSQATGFAKTLSPGIGTYPDQAYLSATRIGRAGLYLRTLKKGDRFSPLGLKGSRKLQDILVDAKIPRELRGRVLVLTCRNDVIWVPGYTVAEGWHIQGPDEASLCITVERGP